MSAPTVESNTVSAQPEEKKRSALRRGLARLDDWEQRHPVLAMLALSVLVVLVVESLCRHSVWKAFGFAGGSFAVFFYNVVLVFATLSPALLFYKRRAVEALLSVLWLVLGVVDWILMFHRTTPLAAIDFQLFSSVHTIIKVYLKTWQLVLIIVGIVLLIAGLVFLFIRCKSRRFPLWQRAYIPVIAFILLFAGTSICLRFDILSGSFTNLPDAYRAYGFPYSFMVGLFDRGIDEPEDYSKTQIGDILEQIHADQEVLPENTPNILFVQLESFFDVNRMKDLRFSKDPNPNFTALKKNYTHGLLTVPSIGAGTANTEFEMITGMSLDYFGTGEYPYKTILQDTVCETICYDLNKLGYTSHAIHNHAGSFYDRNLVFSNLGFNTFTSVEYMQGVEKNPRGWAKDAVLTDEIMKAMNSTYGRDLVYTITVQAHGQYPTERLEDAPYDIAVSGLEDEGMTNAWEYFVNQSYETDAFIGDLLRTLSNYEEPVMVVFFGDHLPSLDIEEEDLSTGVPLQTEYVIWSNFGLKQEKRDLSSYQLAAYALERVGIDTGVITKLHQRYADNPNYEKALELLEYDLLYGNLDAYDGVMPFQQTNLHMGVDEITISQALQTAKGVYVFGENFTKNSRVRFDNDAQDTTFVNSNVLLVEGSALEETTWIDVAQMSSTKLELSVSDSYMFIPQPDQTEPPDETAPPDTTVPEA